MTSLINSSNIVFSSLEDSQSSGLFESTDLLFGVFQLKFNETPIYDKTISINAKIDQSGSMGDKCKDGKTKMEHALHTFKNIGNTIHKVKANVELTVSGFDHELNPIFSDLTIDDSNIIEFRNKLDIELYPRGSTNIELAIKTTKDEILSTKDEDKKYVSLLLTDGLTNIGETNYDKMKVHIIPDITNICIGYGKDHDAIGLQKLVKNAGNYYYIDKIENTGLVFGEILSEILYSSCSDVEIYVINGEIYDFTSNTWNHKLLINSISSGSTKTFHLRSREPELLSISIYGKSHLFENNNKNLILDNIFPSSDFIDENINKELNIYILRQKTQELLFQMHNACMKKLPITDKTILKNKCNELMSYIHKYMQTENMEENELLQRLYADLDIVYQTFNISNNIAAMYSGSRAYSEGNETSYCVHIDPDDIQPLKRQRVGLERCNAGTFDYDSNEQDTSMDIEPVNIYRSSSLSTRNITNRKLDLMRAVSAGQSCEKELDEINENDLEFEELGEV